MPDSPSLSLTHVDSDLLMVVVSLGQTFHASYIMGVRLLPATNSAFGSCGWGVCVDVLNEAARPVVDCNDEEAAAALAHRIRTDWRAGLRVWSRLESMRYEVAKSERTMQVPT